MAKVISLSLPEFAWLSGGDHEPGGDPLGERMVVLHVRSASVIEFFLADNFVPSSDAVKTHRFTYRGAFGPTERYIAVLHYCATTDDEGEIDAIMHKATDWLCAYNDWEDENIAADDYSQLN